MRNMIKAVIAGGPPAIIAAGGAALYLQHELHYLLRPSVIETVAGVGAVGGAVLWSMGKGKRKAAKAEQAQAIEQEPVVEYVQQLRPLPTTHALPRAAKTVISYESAMQQQAERRA